jgi:hypothetical protein
MSTAQEALGAKSPMGADLAAGVEALSLDQVITFTRYQRLVLPLDGFVFWVKAGILTPSALYNSARFNAARYNQSPSNISTTTTFDVTGSLHHATDIRQEEAKTYAANRMIFTALEQVNDLNVVAPDTLWIGTLPPDGDFPGLKFAFSSRGSFYQQADLFHYVGFAVYPDMEPQIIDSPAGFDSRSLIVSNSLPAWLALNSYAPFYGFGMPPGLTLFPSFLAPKNEPPPFGAVDIPPEGTIGLASAPTIDLATRSHYQLTKDRVKVTLWGTRNYNALDFVDCVNQYSTDVGAFGIMNIPIIRDEKRTQSELATIAMKKSVEFEVSYLQNRVNDIARGLIKSSIINWTISEAA